MKDHQLVMTEEELGEITEKLLQIDSINHKLLDTIPYAAMIISRERIVTAANKAALDIGVKVGSFCWDSFGKLVSIPAEDKEYFEKNKKPPKEGTRCYFCEAEEALSSQETANVKVEVGGTLWDTYWVPLNEELYLHYAIDITEKKESD